MSQSVSTYCHYKVANRHIVDQELIKRIQGGEKRLFEVLIRKYNQRLYRIGMSILDNEMEAEDAMQAAYINAYEHLSSFEQRSTFGTWLTRIMLNQCYEQKRKKKHSPANFEQTDNFISMTTPLNELVNANEEKIFDNKFVVNYI